MSASSSDKLLPGTSTNLGRIQLALQTTLLVAAAAFLWSISQSLGLAVVWLAAATVALATDPAGKKAFPLLILAVAIGGAGWAGIQNVAGMPDQHVRERLNEFLPAVPYLLKPIGVTYFFFVVPTAIVAGLVRAISARSWRGGLAVVVIGAGCFGAFLTFVEKHTGKGMSLAPPLKIAEEYWNEQVSIDLGEVVTVPPSRPIPEYDVRVGESYGPHGFRNTMDLYIPRQQVRPSVVIYLHGGGVFEGGTDGKGNGLPDVWRNAMLARGLAVANINYRLAGALPNPARPEATGPHPAQIQDCLAAVRFLRAEADQLGLDGERIGVMRHSYGGGLAALAGVAADQSEFLTDTRRGVSSDVQAVVNSAGITDHRVWAIQGRMAFKMLNLTSADYTFSETAYAQYYLSDRFVGRSFDPDDPAVASLSAITHVGPQCPPFLHIYGMRDCNAPPIQGDLLHGRLKKAGVLSRLVIIPGASHGLADVKGTGELMADFLASHLNR